MRYLRYILVFALMVLGLAKVGAQNDRNFIRQGNRAYHKQKWAAAETQYRKAISKNQKNAQAVYNLGCALMMQLTYTMRFGAAFRMTFITSGCIPARGGSVMMTSGRPCCAMKSLVRISFMSPA